MIQSALLDDRFRDLVDEGRATWNASDVLKLYTETKVSGTPNIYPAITQ